MRKKVIFVFLLNSLLINANAQGIGVKGGFSLADDLYKLYITKMPTDYIAGLTAGISAEIPLAESIYLNPNLLFIKKGTHVEITGAERRIRIRYLEFPIDVMYKYDFVTWKLFAEAGPYLGIGLSARIKEQDNKEKIKFGSEADRFKRFDYGIGFGAGIEINKIQVGLNFGLGFPDISNNESEVLRNRVYTLTVVYSLNDLF